MKILIADVSPLNRQGVKLVLEQSGIIADSMEASSFEELKRQLNQQVGSVMLILDVRLPNLELQEEFLQMIQRPDTRVLMLTDNKDIAFMRWALLNGVHGVIAKTASMEELGEAVQTVLNGRTWRYTDSAEEDQWIGQTTRLNYALRRLSEQENNVLQLVLLGMRNKQIAQSMSLTEHTIKTHMSNILRKLEIENRTQLVIAVKKIEIDQWQRLSA